MGLWGRGWVWPGEWGYISVRVCGWRGGVRVDFLGECLKAQCPLGENPGPRGCRGKIPGSRRPFSHGDPRTSVREGDDDVGPLRCSGGTWSQRSRPLTPIPATGGGPSGTLNSSIKVFHESRAYRSQPGLQTGGNRGGTGEDGSAKNESFPTWGVGGRGRTSQGLPGVSRRFTHTTPSRRPVADRRQSPHVS